MSIRTKADKLAFIAAHPEIVFCKKKYLFVVSHMRSRSSVLCHILGSNPKICGYKELHRSYKDHMALINMQIELVKDLNCKIKNKYLLDKMLHNTLITDRILLKTKPKILFLIREPESTIKSIINMGHSTGVLWHQDPVKATDYYCKRLHQIERLCFRVNSEFLFIDSDALINKTEDTLDKITGWLNLKTPLKSAYTIFKDTGQMGSGDPLENIKHGKLMATVSETNIYLPEDLLAKAKESYNQCKTTLLSNS